MKFIYSMPSQRSVDAAKAIEPIKAELDAARAVITRLYAKCGDGGTAG